LGDKKRGAEVKKVSRNWSKLVFSTQFALRHTCNSTVTVFCYTASMVTKVSSDSPRVESFVLRFVQDAPNGGASGWHAVVVHVQTNEEKTFSDFADAVAFIARYVPLGDFVFKAEDVSPTTNGGHASVIRSQGG
jgi:hypothetical protein